MRPSNIPLEQNRKSKFLNQTLSKYPVELLHNNQIGKVYPNNWRDLSYIRPSEGSIPDVPVENTKYVFKLTECDGFIDQMFLKVSLTTAGDNTGMENKIGVHFFKEIVIRQKNFIICRMNPAYIINRISEMSIDMQQNYNSLLEGTDDFNANTVYWYIPLFCFFTDDEKNNLFLNFHKDITVECTWNSISWVSALTGSNISLGIVRNTYEKMYTNQLIDERKANKRYYLSYDVIPFSKDFSGTDTTLDFELKSNYLISAIHVCGISAGKDLMDIESIQLSLGSNEVININREEMVFYRRNENKDIADMGTTEFSYHFGTRDDLKGHLSLLNQSALLTVNFNNIGAVSGKMWVNLEYRNVLDYTDNGEMYATLTI